MNQKFCHVSREFSILTRVFLVNIVQRILNFSGMYTKLFPAY